MTKSHALQISFPLLCRWEVSSGSEMAESVQLPVECGAAPRMVMAPAVPLPGVNTGIKTGLESQQSKTSTFDVVERLHSFVGSNRVIYVSLFNDGRRCAGPARHLRMLQMVICDGISERAPLAICSDPVRGLSRTHLDCGLRSAPLNPGNCMD